MPQPTTTATITVSFIINDEVDQVSHGGRDYTCLVDHVAHAGAGAGGNEPGVGGATATFWRDDGVTGGVAPAWAAGNSYEAHTEVGSVTVTVDSFKPNSIYHLVGKAAETALKNAMTLTDDGDVDGGSWI